MKWKALKALTIAELAATVAKWQKGEDAEGAAEFAADFTDNVLFPFNEGSKAERVSDALIQFGGPTVMPALGARLAQIVAGISSARPLAGLPF